MEMFSGVRFPVQVPAVDTSCPCSLGQFLFSQIGKSNLNMFGLGCFQSGGSLSVVCCKIMVFLVSNVILVWVRGALNTPGIVKKKKKKEISRICTQFITFWWCLSCSFFFLHWTYSYTQFQWSTHDSNSSAPAKPAHHKNPFCFFLSFRSFRLDEPRRRVRRDPVRIITCIHNPPRRFCLARRNRERESLVNEVKTALPTDHSLGPHPLSSAIFGEKNKSSFFFNKNALECMQWRARTMEISVPDPIRDAKG
jgi:hypothetical protein